MTTATAEPASAKIIDLLQVLLAQGGSDLFITAGYPPAMKKDGQICKLASQPLDAQQAHALVRAVMNERQRAEFDHSHECNFAIAPAALGRFRVSAFVQQGQYGMVMRVIPAQIPTLEQLAMPDALKELALSARGLCLVVGATGSGKSSTLAAMVDWRNRHSCGHILTIEDPMEFIHSHRHCIVTQREVGSDTDSWEVALKNSLRQAPDVILIGEIRDAQTMSYAIQFAETGHLCLATLHASNAHQALDRIVNFLPQDRREQWLMDLALNLRAIVSQRLVMRSDQQGRVPAVEILRNSPLVADLIFKGALGELQAAMEKSRQQGMQTLDQALFDLHEDGRISYEQALRHADGVNDLRLRIQREGRRGGAPDLAAGTEQVRLL
jgi:twitching motility protein PilU